jgi:RNA polymerase sigma-70 factor (ECF subfamily)
VTELSEAAHLAAARTGDQEAFGRLIGPYRRELLVHCYRLLGTVEEAEDALQETWLRAWRRLDTFAGHGSLRAWLYRVATNTALNAQAGRRVRVLPTATHAPADPHAPLPAPSPELPWLEPLPDALLPDLQPGPDALYEMRESVELAFLAVLQLLPGRQRAVLLMRDVLGWSAAEAGEVLDMSVVAVNSALQRARTTVQKQSAGPPSRPTAPSPPTAALLARYVQAWEAADVAGLVALLREDAVLTMPPVAAWYQGRQAIAAFLQAHLFAGEARGRYRLVATHANGQPAFAVYTRDAAGVYRPGALQVLTLADDALGAIHDFLALDDRLFSRFDLPPTG